MSGYLCIFLLLLNIKFILKVFKLSKKPLNAVYTFGCQTSLTRTKNRSEGW